MDCRQLPTHIVHGLCILRTPETSTSSETQIQVTGTQFKPPQSSEAKCLQSCLPEEADPNHLNPLMTPEPPSTSIAEEPQSRATSAI